MPRRFKGIIARDVTQNIEDSNLPPHLSKFRLDWRALDIMNPGVAGVRIQAEHREPTDGVGRVISASMTSTSPATREWHVEFEIDNESECGDLLVGCIDRGYLSNLSLSHRIPEMTPIEVSVVQCPARPGCVITEGIRPIRGETDSKADRYMKFRDRARLISASAPYPPNIIVATLPPTLMEAATAASTLISAGAPLASPPLASSLAPAPVTGHHHHHTISAAAPIGSGMQTSVNPLHFLSGLTGSDGRFYPGLNTPHVSDQWREQLQQRGMLPLGAYPPGSVGDGGVASPAPRGASATGGTRKRDPHGRFQGGNGDSSSGGGGYGNEDEEKKGAGGSSREKTDSILRIARSNLTSDDKYHLFGLLQEKKESKKKQPRAAPKKKKGGEEKDADGPSAMDERDDGDDGEGAAPISTDGDDGESGQTGTEAEDAPKGDKKKKKQQQQRPKGKKQQPTKDPVDEEEEEEEEEEKYGLGTIDRGGEEAMEEEEQEEKEGRKRDNQDGDLYDTSGDDDDHGRVRRHADSQDESIQDDGDEEEEKKQQKKPTGGKGRPKSKSGAKAKAGSHDDIPKIATKGRGTVTSRPTGTGGFGSGAKAGGSADRRKMGDNIAAAFRDNAKAGLTDPAQAKKTIADVREMAARSRVSASSSSSSSSAGDAVVDAETIFGRMTEAQQRECLRRSGMVELHRRDARGIDGGATGGSGDTVRASKPTTPAPPTGPGPIPSFVTRHGFVISTSLAPAGGVDDAGNDVISAHYPTHGGGFRGGAVAGRMGGGGGGSGSKGSKGAPPAIPVHQSLFGRSSVISAAAPTEWMDISRMNEVDGRRLPQLQESRSRFGYSNQSQDAKMGFIKALVRDTCPLPAYEEIKEHVPESMYEMLCVSFSKLDPRVGLVSASAPAFTSGDRLIRRAGDRRGGGGTSTKRAADY